MVAFHPSGAFRRVATAALVAIVSALPVAASGQNLASVPGQTRLQREVGRVLQGEVCPALMASAGISRDDGTPQGDLLGRCTDLSHTANEINGSGPTTDSLNLGTAQLNAALDSIAHPQLPAFGRGASEITLLHVGAIGRRLYALREGATGVQVSGDVHDTEGGRVASDDLLPGVAAAEEVDTRGARDSLEDGGLGVFLNVRGGLGDRDSGTEELGFDFEHLGGTVGIDWRFNEYFVGGLAGGYTRATRDFDRSGGEMDSDSASGWAYLGYQNGGLYIDGLYGFARHWIDTERNIVIPVGPAPTGAAMAVSRSADGDTRAAENQLAGEVGYLFTWNELGVGPVSRLEYVRIDVNSFTETGANGLDLDYEEDEITSFVLNLGAEASYDIPTGFGAVTPRIRAAWAHQFEDDPRSLVAKYRFDPSQSVFFVRTGEPDRDYVDLAASVAASLTGGFALMLSYDTLVGHSDIDVHTLMLTGRIAF